MHGDVAITQQPTCFLATMANALLSALQARRAGFRYQGGKVDDITVVVSYVTDPDEPAAPRTKLGPPPPPPRSGLDSPL